MHLFKAWNQHGICLATVCASEEAAATVLGKYPEYADRYPIARRKETEIMWQAPGTVFVRDYATANRDWVPAAAEHVC